MTNLAILLDDGDKSFFNLSFVLVRRDAQTLGRDQLMNYEGTEFLEVLFWNFLQAALIPALLPTIAIVIFGVLILRRLPKKGSNHPKNDQV